jgi:HK97 family phage portal protein
MSNSDAQFVESEEYRVADIARFFGTPLYLLNAGKQAYSSNEQNSIDFVKYTLLPIINEREQEDSYKLLMPGERAKGLRIKREVKGLLRGDSAAQAAWYRTMRELGVYSPDDICELEDRPPVPGGKSRYASLNHIPLELWEALSILRAENKGGGE